MMYNKLNNMRALIGLMLLSYVLVTSCENKPADKSEPMEIKKGEEKLEGKFILRGSEESYMIFNSDGSGIEQTMVNGRESFEWTIEDNELCVSKSFQLDDLSEPIENKSCGTFELSDGKLTWKIDGLNVVLYKKK
jgi:hypothetical protein